ncbi:MAG: universal stress protein [Gaiellaceae bacterium]
MTHAVTDLFTRVVCAVGGARGGTEAVRQVERLRSGEGTVVLASVAETRVTVRTGAQAPAWRKELRADAQRAIDEARTIAPDADARLADGRASTALRWILEDEEATLVACENGHSRTAGIVLGSVATALLHDAPCSVLVARAPAEPDAFPTSIAVGVDGSPESLRAAEVARELAERFGARVRAVTATGGKPVSVATVGTDELPVELDERAPVDALVAAAEESDLLVVGSRGLHGIGSLGSVSERVAHRAACSVLVVRPPAVSASSDGIRVRDVMTRPAVTAGPETSVRELARLMVDRKVGSVVVVDASEAIAGIVTETDFEISDEPVQDTTFKWPRFLGRHVWSGGSLEEVFAEIGNEQADSIMTSPVETVDAGTELWEAVRTLTESGHKRLPVLDGGQLVGVVSQHDLLKVLLAGPAG